MTIRTSISSCNIFILRNANTELKVDSLLTPNVVEYPVLNLSGQKHELSVGWRRRFEAAAILHPIFGVMPLADKFAILALQRPAKVHADIGDSPGLAIGPIDIHFPAKERDELGSFVRDFFNLAKWVFHDKFLLTLYL
jgi:hypothetical protein